MVQETQADFGVAKKTMQGALTASCAEKMKTGGSVGDRPELFSIQMPMHWAHNRQ
jgi:hypothetical protein